MLTVRDSIFAHWYNILPAPKSRQDEDLDRRDPREVQVQQRDDFRGA